MTVVDTLDQSALRHGTETESGRRRRGPISWNHGRSWSSASTFYLTWNRTWCDAEAIREGQPRRGGRSLKQALEPKGGHNLCVNDDTMRCTAQWATYGGEQASPVSGAGFGGQAVLVARYVRVHGAPAVPPPPDGAVA